MEEDKKFWRVNLKDRFDIFKDEFRTDPFYVNLPGDTSIYAIGEDNSWFLVTKKELEAQANFWEDFYREVEYKLICGKKCVSKENSKVLNLPKTPTEASPTPPTTSTNT